MATTSIAGALIALLLGGADAAPATFTPAQLREDLQAAVSAIEATHPEIDHSIATADMKRAVADLAQSFDRPLTRDQAWLQFARLNPLFADAHLVFGYADWRGDMRAHVRDGGGLFPFEVLVATDGTVRIASVLGGKATPHRGARVLRINGQAATDVSRQLLALVPGDTPAFRAAMLSRRWALFYWKAYGTPARFELDLPERKLDVPAAYDLPAVLHEDFADQFSFTLLPGDAALLRLGTFVWPDRAQFFAFARDAFARMRQSGTRRLIIDVRDNSGGDDDMWRDGIVPYLADKPFRTGSTYRKKVIPGHQDEGQVLGEVVRDEIKTWITPAEEDKTPRFEGKVYVLFGPYTYSSAVLFANVMQDFGFGTLAGRGGAVRANQSGGTQRAVLPHTGLVVVSPRFVLDRPLPRAAPMVEPDVAIDDDPLDEHDAVNQVLSLP